MAIAPRNTVPLSKESFQKDGWYFVMKMLDILLIGLHVALGIYLDSWEMCLSTGDKNLTELFASSLGFILTIFKVHLKVWKNFIILAGFLGLLDRGLRSFFKVPYGRISDKKALNKIMDLGKINHSFWVKWFSGTCSPARLKNRSKMVWNQTWGTLQ